jgi:hypothetical protein
VALLFLSEFSAPHNPHETRWSVEKSGGKMALPFRRG